MNADQWYQVILQKQASKSEKQAQKRNLTEKQAQKRNLTEKQAQRKIEQNKKPAGELKTKVWKQIRKKLKMTKFTQKHAQISFCGKFKQTNCHKLRRKAIRKTLIGNKQAQKTSNFEIKQFQNKQLARLQTNHNSTNNKPKFAGKPQGWQDWGLPICLFWSKILKLWLLMHLAFFENQKKADNMWLFSGGKSWLWQNIVSAAYSLQIFWRESIVHAGCKEYCKDFTGALKMFDVFNKKQMYDSIIMGKENASYLKLCYIDVPDEF